MKNKLADFFNSSTELSAIDHFLQLMVKNNTFDQKMKLLQEQFQHSEQLQSEYLKRIEPYRVCRRPTFLRECPDEKSKIYP